ncbi:diguanylate cyclase domain-containing protein [Pseudomonas sp. LF245]
MKRLRHTRKPHTTKNTKPTPSKATNRPSSKKTIKPMKLDKLTALYTELLKEFASHNIKCTLHYKNENQWFELHGISINTSTIQSLDKSIKEPIAQYSTNSLTARYYLKTYDATVSLAFTKSPRKDTRARYRALIEKTQESSSNAYRVSHHALTHLLAKEAFREKLEASINLVDKQASPDIETQESEHSETLAVMALDIDYFKQVNDTWGHLYGDQVLKAFGKRLEDCASAIEKSPFHPLVYLGHPSGEEFLVLITASAPREQFFAWANQLRSSICDVILPSDDEWCWLCKSDNLSALTPPPPSDRGISTSIGLAFHTGMNKSESGSDQSAGLLDLADTALYRAKAAGRNQVILYDEILSSCGRVLEQDTKTGVVALDIGSNVGVLIGQEFKVYHPTFSGKTKFSVNDGRTTRTLGIYPRVESCRIVVFNSQPEISFAFIDTADNSIIELAAGSHLEAIPAGSIGHLLSNSSRYFTSPSDGIRSGDIKPLQEFIASSQDTLPFAIVIRFTKEAEYLKNYGTAALNKALAKLYSSAKTALININLIAVLDSGSICLVGPNDNYNENNLNLLMNEISAEFPSLEAIAGICCNEDLSALTDKGHFSIDSKSIIELARFSASGLISTPNTHLYHFAVDTPTKTLQALRKTHSFDIAYTDFKRLIDLGINSSSIYNLGGLTATNLGLTSEALNHFQAAYTKTPKTTIYKTNFGTSALKLGEIELGLKTLNTLSAIEIENTYKKHPYGFFAYAALLAKAKLSGSVFFDEARFNSIAERALALSEVSQHLPSSKQSIISALET